MGDNIQAAVAVIVQNEQVLLGRKLTGEIGCGKLNGPGGKRMPGESYLQCLIRETEEELCITLDPAFCTRVGRLHCYSGKKPYTISQVDVYRCTAFTGVPQCTDDMEPEWHGIAALPWAEMHEGDVHWFEKAIRGETFSGVLFYRTPGEGFISYAPS